MKDTLFRMKQLLLSLSIALSGATLTGCSDYEYQEDKVDVIDYLNRYMDYKETTYAPGEHVIVVPFEVRDTSKNVQIEVHDGYDIIGITDTSSDTFYIMYQNNVEVVVQPSMDGFIQFGTPTNQYTR
ncbi:MAG: hypothetical protein K6C11_00665 [Bacilli bacterium]|nr:hypothetical protein [Bacilli bacterium]